MKASFVFKLSLLLFTLLALLSAGEMAPTAGAGASRLPEHTCCRVIDAAGKCSPEECRKKCWGQLRAAGRCRGAAACLCTFYCQQPPV